jgi:hypothetical protein
MIMRMKVFAIAAFQREARQQQGDPAADALPRAGGECPWRFQGLEVFPGSAISAT